MRGPAPPREGDAFAEARAVKPNQVGGKVNLEKFIIRSGKCILQLKVFEARRKLDSCSCVRKDSVDVHMAQCTVAHTSATLAPVTLRLRKKTRGAAFAAVGNEG